jgi:hypothetical protein
MEYGVVIFKNLEKDKPDEGYEGLGKGLQYHVEGSLGRLPTDIQMRIGILFGKILSGHEDGTRMLIPKGKTLEVIFKD